MSGMSESSESSESSGSVRAPPASRVITLLQSAWGNCFSPTPPFASGGSRSYLARPLAVGTAAGFEKCMGLPAPFPGQVSDLHPAKLRAAISRMRGAHLRYGGMVMFFPDLSQQVR